MCGRVCVGGGAGMRVPEEPERHLPHPMKQIQIKHGTKSLQALLLLEYLYGNAIFA